MRKLGAVLFAIVLAIGLAACAQLGLLTGTPSTSEVMREVSQVRAQFESAYGQGDAQALASLYTQDARFLPSDNPTLRGRAEIRSYFQTFFDQMASQSITITPSESDASGDLVYEWGTYTVSFTPQGGSSMTDQGRYTVILERQADGAFRIVFDIDNSPQSQSP